MFHIVFPPDVTNPLVSFPVTQTPVEASNWYEKLTRADNKDNAWIEMAKTEKDYAENNGYILAAVFGTTPNTFDFYYVKPGRDESMEIINRIRTFKYYVFSSGKFAKNYALPKS